MRITVVGLGYVGLVTAAGLARWDHEVIGLEADPERLTQPARTGRSRSTSPVSTSSSRPTPQPARCGSAGARPRRSRRPMSRWSRSARPIPRATGRPARILRCLTEVVPLLRRRRRPRRPLDHPARLRPPARLDRRRDPRPGRTPAGPGHAQPRVHPREPGRRRLPRPGSGRRRGHPRPGWARRPHDPPRLPPGRRADHRHARRRRLACRSSAPTSSWRPRSRSPTSSPACATRTAAGSTRSSGRWPTTPGSAGASSRPASATAVRACPTRSPRPSATPPGSGSRRRSSPRSTGSTTTSATELVDRLAELTGGELAGRRIALLGLTFKPGTDDLREAPALTVAALLIERGADGRRLRPDGARPRAGGGDGRRPDRRRLGRSRRSPTPTPRRSITEWAEFAGLDWDAAAATMRQALIVDGRNALAPDVLARAGFTYVGFGRGRMDPEEVGSTVPAVARHAGRRRPGGRRPPPRSA